MSSEIVRVCKQQSFVSDSDPLELLSANQAMASRTYDFPPKNCILKTFYAIVAQGLPTRPLEILWDNDNCGLGSPSTTHAQDSQYTKDISYDVNFEKDVVTRNQVTLPCERSLIREIKFVLLGCLFL